MKRMLIRCIRSVGGIVIGYIVFVLGTWVAQEAILGGVSYRRSSLTVLALAGVLTPLAAVIGGLLTSAIAGVRPFLHIVPMCLLVVLETAFLYSRGRVDGPLWFEASAGGSLIFGAIIGAICWRWLANRRSRVAGADQRDSQG